MAYACDSEDGSPAVVLITNLDNGDTMSWCAQCFPSWVVTMAQEFQAAAQAAAAQEPTANGTGVQEGEPAPDPAPPKRRRQGRQGPPPALTSEASPFPDPTPVDE